MDSQQLSTTGSLQLAWIRKRYCPVVMVVGATSAEHICAASGLKLLDLFSHCARLTDVNVPIRIQEYNVRVRDLTLRFFEGTSLYQPALQSIEARLKSVLEQSVKNNGTVEAATAFTADDVLQKIDEAYREAEEQVKREIPPATIYEEEFNNRLQQLRIQYIEQKLPHLTPWFKTYEQELFRLLCFGEHESIDHPLGALLVISSDMEQPVAGMEQLMGRMVHQQPILMKDSNQGGNGAAMLPFTESSFPKHCVMVHDSRAGSQALSQAEQRYRELASRYGKSRCSFVTINSAINGSGVNVDWDKYRHGSVSTGDSSLEGAGEPKGGYPQQVDGLQLGALVSDKDINSFQKCVKEFVTNTFLPKIEERMCALRERVKDSKKGLSYRMKNLATRFLSGPGSTRALPVSNQPPLEIYRWDTIEAATRQLADLAFMLGRFDLANVALRYVSGDFRSDGRSKYYAAAQELLGLTVSVDVADSNDPVKYFTRAADHYESLRTPESKLFAMRTYLIMARYCINAGRWMDAQSAFHRAHVQQEDAIRGGLLLEQAAYCLLKVRPAQKRKFAFFMVLAGLKFFTCVTDVKGIEVLALSSYKLVHQICGSKGWCAIEEHLNNTLGQQAFSNGFISEALSHFMQLLTVQHRPTAVQQTYLRQFLIAVQAQDQLPDNPNNNLFQNFPVPVVEANDVYVQFDGVIQMHGHLEISEASSKIWGLLQELVLETDGSNSSNGFERGSQANLQTLIRDQNVSVAREEIGVEVKFNNILGLELLISDVTVKYEGDCKVVTTTERFSLKPHESVTRRLILIPQGPGNLQILGVSWSVAQNEALPTIPTPRTNNDNNNTNNVEMPKLARKGTKIRAMAQFKTHGLAPHKQLEFQVSGLQARLEVDTSELQSNFAFGEVSRGILILQNTGAMPVFNMSLGVNLGCLYIQGKVNSVRSEVEGDLLELMDLDGGELTKGSVVKGPKGKIHHGRRFQILDSGQTLEPGTTVYLPVWLYPDFIGREVLQMVWRYETQEDGAGIMKQRLLQIAHVIDCQPLVEVGIGQVGFRVEGLFQVKISIRDQNQNVALRKVDMVQIKDVRYLGDWMQINPIDHGLALDLKQGEEGVIVCEVEERQQADSTINKIQQKSAMQALLGSKSDLVVIWRAKCLGMGDVTQRTGISPLSEKILSQVYSSEGISIAFQGEICKTHDFTKSSICTVSVKLSLKNLNKESASVVLEAASGSQQQVGWTEVIPSVTDKINVPLNQNQQDMKQPIPGSNNNQQVTMPLGNRTASGIHWLGLSRSIIQELKPNEQKLIQLQLAVFAPGLYELSGINCSWNIPKLQTTHTTCKPMPALMEIKQQQKQQEG